MVIRNALVALIITASGCNPVSNNPAPQTVIGQESAALLPTVSGYIVMDRPPGGIVAVRLPDLQEIVVRNSSPPGQQLFPMVHTVSGPDEDGRIVYIDSDMLQKRHWLR